MSEIVITRKHRLTAKKARAAAELVAADLRQEYNLNFAWGEDGALHFDRSGLHGRLTLAKGEATVQVHLGFLLRPFRGSLEREIHEYFDQRFA
ncbi:MAG TPA: polyhydroxyalkanoic acid system family protein [Azonexus sp.]|jgi:putative polyhydroxyalkanoate system protein|nr:polyhydroxyalkanoic acid system family protein [Azonexus sp.]